MIDFILASEAGVIVAGLLIIAYIKFYPKWKFREGGKEHKKFLKRMEDINN